MKRTLLSLTLLTTLLLPAGADAFAIRIGTNGLLSPDTDFAFAVGIDSDRRLVAPLAFNSGTLFVVGEEFFRIDGYLGLKVFVPIDRKTGSRLHFRGNFLLNYNYLTETNSYYEVDGGMGVGGVAGVGVVFPLGGGIGFGVDADLQLYRYLYPSEYPDDDLQVSLALLATLQF